MVTLRWRNLLALVAASFTLLVATARAQAMVWITAPDEALMQRFVTQVEQLTGLQVQFEEAPRADDQKGVRGLLVIEGPRIEDIGNADAAKSMARAIGSSRTIAFHLRDKIATILDDVTDNRFDVADLESFATVSVDFGAAKLTHVVEERMYIEEHDDFVGMDAPQDAAAFWKWAPHVHAMKVESGIVKPTAVNRIEAKDPKASRTQSTDKLTRGDVYYQIYFSKEGIAVAEYAFELDEDLVPRPLSSLSNP